QVSLQEDPVAVADPDIDVGELGVALLAELADQLVLRVGERASVLVLPDARRASGGVGGSLRGTDRGVRVRRRLARRAVRPARGRRHTGVPVRDAVGLAV